MIEITESQKEQTTEIKEQTISDIFTNSVNFKNAVQSKVKERVKKKKAPVYNKEKQVMCVNNKKEQTSENKTEQKQNHECKCYKCMNYNANDNTYQESKDFVSATYFNNVVGVALLVLIVSHIHLIAGRKSRHS